MSGEGLGLTRGSLQHSDNRQKCWLLLTVKKIQGTSVPTILADHHGILALEKYESLHLKNKQVPMFSKNTLFRHHKTLQLS